MKRTKRNEGVALIVVLGFLSLLLVMAVAFLGEARTERTVSDYSLEAIRARQLMRTALAAAQNDYSEALWDTRKALPDEEWEVFTSEASGQDAISGKQGTLGGSGVVITNGEIMEWVPARYKTRDVMDEMEDAEWILVREEPGKSSRILGRYAYICLDSSGGLDANWVAREDEVANRDTSRSLTNRPHHSIREVPLGLLPEVADASQFKSYRKGWKGFDSLQTLVKLTDGVPNDGTDSTQNTRWQPERAESKGRVGLVSNLVSDLVSYSLTAYRGGRYHRGSGEWDKPEFMDPTTGAGWESVLAPLQGQGWKRDDMENQLRDYLSSSKAPRGVDYPSIKAVPMFNEMWVKLDKFTRSTEPDSKVDDEPTYTYKAKVTVGIETWFPFPSQDNDGGSYTLKAPSLSMQSSAGGAGQILLPVRLQTTDGPVNVQSADPSPSPATATITASYGKPQTHSFTYDVDLMPVKAVRDSNATLQWGARGMVWQVTSDIDLLYGGTVVDRLPKNLKGEGSAPPISGDGNGGQAGPYSMEVTDPRLNHLANEWQAPDSDAGTPGDINSVTKGLPDFQKEGQWMYCRNGKMESLAEFGFFSTGKPWKTLDLCTAEGKEFLALGTLDKGVRDDLAGKGVHYTNATINVNTYRTNVLASAFYDLSFMPTPNTDASKIEKENAFTEEQAKEIAKRIQAETASEPYQSGQDWANTPAMKDGGYLQGQGLTRTEREAVLRNTDGLFSVSDSLFTVILIAQSVKEGPDSKNVGKWDDEDQVTGERRGVALVWRDPFKTGNNLHHEMMVRMFRFLND
jgi:hypothetical protein